MPRKITPIVSLLLIVCSVLLGFLQSTPQDINGLDAPEDKFSTARAFQHVEAISENPHYIGSPQHSRVRNYLISELQEMGLFVEMQQTYALNNTGVLAQPQNILTRIEGSGEGKALLLLSHYDSAVHSSFGASDAASGVATILEGLRAYLASGATPVNDIIVMFTDAEEVGLNGAEAFVDHHRWAGDVGLALNFEARGSGGPSFMLVETNTGNKKLIEHFIEADPNFPVATSLAYSVYKMLPNDTDLTVLREQENINGFNFAFIDDHFDYHTATDVAENLDIKSLAHQGSYLMPLLKYFDSVPLTDFDSPDDLIYFNVPILKMISYPFSWSMPLWVSASVLLVVLLIYGIANRKLRPRIMLKGFLPLIIVLLASGLLAYLFWEFCLYIYPHYQEIEQGFTYNGYYYIAAVVFLALAICFYTYLKFQKPENTVDLFIAPLVLWLAISAGAAFNLKGAAYFIIPVFFGLLQLYILIQWRKPNVVLLTILNLPAIFILQPFIVSFPVALGLKMLFLAAVLVTLLWVLLWPVFGFFKKTQALGFLCFTTFILLFVIAHFKSDFTSESPKPNSLVYLLNADEGVATWNTYDQVIDSWTAPYFDETAAVKPIDASFSNKYNSGFTRSAVAPVVQVAAPFINVEKSKNTEGNTSFSVKIAPNRDIDRMELFADRKVDFESFLVNGQRANGISPEENNLHIFKNRWTDRLLTYYAANRDTLRLEFTVAKSEKIPELTLYEASHNLIENKLLNVPPRTAERIPRPFVLNDAVVLKKTIKLN